MIRRKKFIFIILSSALLISGCGRNEAEDVQNYIQIEDGAEGFDELDWKEGGDGGFR